MRKTYYINVLCAWIQNRDKRKKKQKTKNSSILAHSMNTILSVCVHCPLLVRLVWILTFVFCFFSSVNLFFFFSLTSLFRLLVHVGQLSLTSVYSNNVHIYPFRRIETKRRWGSFSIKMSLFIQWFMSIDWCETWIKKEIKRIDTKDRMNELGPRCGRFVEFVNQKSDNDNFFFSS